ncbi:hypothetical protein ES703_118721 [subsurface metagenome]
MKKQILKDILFWIAIIILIVVGFSVINDIIFLIFKTYPPKIIKFFIALIFITILYKFTIVGKEIDKRLMKLAKKFGKKKMMGF